MAGECMSGVLCAITWNRRSLRSCISPRWRVDTHSTENLVITSSSKAIEWSEVLRLWERYNRDGYCFHNEIWPHKIWSWAASTTCHHERVRHPMKNTLARSLLTNLVVDCRSIISSFFLTMWTKFLSKLINSPGCKAYSINEANLSPISCFKNSNWPIKHAKILLQLRIFITPNSLIERSHRKSVPKLHRSLFTDQKLQNAIAVAKLAQRHLENTIEDSKPWGWSFVICREHGFDWDQQISQIRTWICKLESLTGTKSAPAEGSTSISDMTVEWSAKGSQRVSRASIE